MARPVRLEKVEDAPKRHPKAAGSSMKGDTNVDPLTLRGFFLIALLTAPLGAAGGWLAIASEGITSPVGLATSAALGGLVVGFIVAGCCHFVAYVKNVRSLNLSDAELQFDEVIVWAPPGMLVYYQTGRPHLPWNAVVGKFVLTNRRLVFLTFRGQPFRPRLSIPLPTID